MQSVWWLLVSLAVVQVEAARILAVVPSFPRSHHVIIQAVLRTLAQAGHHLTVYSPYPLDNPSDNYTHVTLYNMRLDQRQLDHVTHTLQETPAWRCYDSILDFHKIMFDRVFSNEHIRRLLRSGEKFDLIITEPLLSQEYLLVLGHVFKAPVVGIASTLNSYLVNRHMGNTLSLAFIPDKCVPFTTNMTFGQRLFNTFSILRGLYVYYQRHLPKIEARLKKVIPGAPPLSELTQGLSLMFVNDHMTADYAQARPPGIVPIGGIHIQPAQRLPQDIQEFMDGAEHGVILFSLGTYVSDSETFNQTMSVFRVLPQRVVWKTTVAGEDGLSEGNVMMVRWSPQRDILAHPKCVLFITHGGLSSLHETVYSGVPVVGIPHYIDQHRNVAYFLEQGVGVRVPAGDLSENSLTAAVHTVLGDPTYRINMQRLSRIFRDTPLTPAQSVVFWTEYVLRHGGAPHLKPVAARLPWYQLALLDILGVTIAATTALLFLLYLLLTKVVSRFFFKNVNSRLTILNKNK